MQIENGDVDKKQAFFQVLLPLINNRIGRDTKPHEREAIAFVVEESHQDLTNAELFLSGSLGVEQVNLGRDAAIKIHNSVYDAKVRKINSLIAENPSDAERLNLIKENIQIGHNGTIQNYQGNGPIEIGAVQQDWVPAWFRNPNSTNSALRQQG